ncbi:MAG: hypothetical protein KC656_01790 [Myxococcales bacterium]|nr:hypothetical protein [Myxococcales bacterium]
MKQVFALALGLTLATACGKSEDYINLDGVLDAFVLSAKTLEAAMPPPMPAAPPTEAAPDGAPAEDHGGTDAASGEAGTGDAAGTEAPAVPTEPTVDPKVQAKPELEAMFLKTFAANLNKSKETIGYGKPLGVAFEKDGSFLGFEDPNGNMTKDAGEKDVFKVEVDWERERLIATDLQHKDYHRDHTYRPSGMGFFGGYMVGRMLGGQTSAGITSSRFSSMTMKPSGYHKSVPGARSYSKSGSSSVRSSGGSRSYRGGK